MMNTGVVTQSGHVERAGLSVFRGTRIAADSSGSLGGGTEKSGAWPCRFVLLGELQVINDDGEFAPSPPKQLQVLALLLLRANQTVQNEALMNELWAGHPPSSASTTVQTYVYQLRKMFRQRQLVDRPDDVLQTRSLGYSMHVRPGQLDVHDFEEYRRRGRAHLLARRFPEASRDLRAALNLWTDVPLGNVRQGSEITAHLQELQEQRRSTLQMAIEAELEMGLHRDLVPEIQLIISRYPYDEWFYGALMTAMDRSGRRGDALHVYRSLQMLLDDELGIAPSCSTEKLYLELLG